MGAQYIGDAKTLAAPSISSTAVRQTLDEFTPAFLTTRG
jgi:hypothetical protein